MHTHMQVHAFTYRNSHHIMTTFTFRFPFNNTVLSIHLAMDWNEMNQQLIHESFPYITLLKIGHKLATH